MRVIILLLFTGIGTSALASEIETMVCENPRREYQVRFARSENSFLADKTAYRILAVEETSEKLIVVGVTVGDGPTFRAHFKPYKKMEFFSDSQLQQTDGCR
ncbi:hypothetical protein [Agrobacterium sp. P15N1-A]|uniref:hypothetical protein n=1 Tax=Agrobacterium sp. P15N1-A TaxID=3342820 RepID=UPI0037D77D6D